MSKVLDDLKGLNIADTTSGTNATFETFNGSNLKGHWKFSRVRMATVNNFYDQAFNLRYNAAGDRPTKINEVLGISSGHFRNAIYLFISNNTPTMITSTADNCKILRGVGINTTTIDQNGCPGGTGHTSGGHRCVSWTRSYEDFIATRPGNDTTTSALWTGNRLFDNNGAGTNQCNRSFSWYNGGITLQELGANNSSFYESRIPLVTHELSHQYGAPDHYHEILDDNTCRGKSLCRTCNPTTGRPTYCIMNDGWRSDLRTCNSIDVWCPGCRADMTNHINDHH